VSDTDPKHVGPGVLIAALIAVGLLGGRRGELALRRLKRLAGTGFLISVAGFVVLLTLAPLNNDTAFVPMLFLGVAAMAGVLWCYVAFATWLTRCER
jgi:hypothetical protein